MKTKLQFSPTFLVVTIVVIFLCIPAPTRTLAAPVEPIKLGIISSFSGPAAIETKNSLNGCKVCVEETYKSQILGRPIELLIRDDALSPDKAVKNFRELNLVHKVDFTLGFFSSACACAVTPLAETLKKPVLFWDSKSPKQIVELGNRYVFRTVADTSMDVTAVAQLCANKPWTKFALIAPDYEYGHSAIDFFKMHMKKLKPGIEIVGEYWPKLGEVDFTPYINPILRAEPDCVFAVIFGSDLMAFRRQAEPYDLFKKMSVILLNEEDRLFAMGKEFPEGVFTSTSYHFNFLKTKASKEFVNGYMKKFNEIPGTHSFYGYVGTQFVLEAMKRAGTTDNEKVMNVLKSLTVETPQGPITIREYDQQGDMAEYIGQAYKDPKYPDFLVLKEILYIPGKEAMIPIEQVKKMRKK